MPTTTNFGWTTPADTDLVKDGAAAIRTLAGNIDTSLVDLKGGTTGQVLSKNSNTDLDFTFTTITATPTSAAATVATSESTTSGTFTDLTTAGPAVTLTTGTKALVIITSRISTDTDNRGGVMGVTVSGASTITAADTTSLRFDNGTGVNIIQSSAVFRMTLTAGSNTFTAKYRREGGASTATFANRSIIVIDLGS